MNACGNPAFSFAALEMRRFQSGDAEMLVPRVIGDTRTSDNIAGASGRKRWTIENFFTDVDQKLGPEEKAIIQELYQFAKQNADEVRMGTGSASGSITFILEHNNATGSVFSVYSNGAFAINFGYMAEKICSQDDIEEFQNQLATIPSFSEIKGSKKYYFNMDLTTAFSSPEYLEQFKVKVLNLKRRLASTA